MQQVADIEYFFEFLDRIERKYKTKELPEYKLTQCIVEGTDHIFEFDSVTGRYLR